MFRSRTNNWFTSIFLNIFLLFSVHLVYDSSKMRNFLFHSYQRKNTKTKSILVHLLLVQACEMIAFFWCKRCVVFSQRNKIEKLSLSLSLSGSYPYNQKTHLYFSLGDKCMSERMKMRKNVRSCATIRKNFTCFCYQQHKLLVRREKYSINHGECAHVFHENENADLKVRE